MGLCWLLGLLVLLLLSQAKVVAFAALFVCALAALAFPCFVSGLLALPLCGAAPTFLCMPQRKVGAVSNTKCNSRVNNNSLPGAVFNEGFSGPAPAKRF